MLRLHNIKRFCILATLLVAWGTVWGQSLLEGKKWTTAKSVSGAGGTMQGAAYYNGKIYQFVNQDGQDTRTYTVYDIANNSWTTGVTLNTGVLASCHFGSACFGPESTKTYSVNGTSHTSQYPLLFVTAHDTKNANGNILIHVIDLELGQAVTTLKFPHSDKRDDKIAAYDFAGGKIYVFGYPVNVLEGHTPYTVWTYDITSFNTFTSSEITMSPNLTTESNAHAGIGGPDTDGIQKTLACGTLQDCHYHNGYIYYATSRGSEYNRTEFAKVHALNVSTWQVEKTMVCNDATEPEGFVFDGTDFYMTCSSKKLWKLSEGTGYDANNYQPATLISGGTYDGYYEIKTASQFVWFKSMVYNGCTTMKAYLANDIDMTGQTDPFTYYIYNSDIQSGTSTYKFEAQFAFRGTFDGNGHTIKNVNITSTPYYNDGVFPYVMGATIKNVTVEGNIKLTTCKTSAGSGQSVSNVGLIGYMDGGTLENVDVKGLTIDETVAGVSGTINKLIGSENGTITKTNCVTEDPSSTTHTTAGGHVYINGFCSLSDASTSETGYYETPEGNGTEASPYLINNAGKLWWFANYVNGLGAGNQAIHAKLTADINMEGSTRGSFPGIGKYQGAVYAGTFDGQGHTISNFYISGATNRGGLFSYTDGATIKNFNLSGEFGISSGIKHGSVVGWAINTTIEKIYSSVNITSNAAQQIGGLVGCLQTGTVRQCRYNGTISSESAYNKVGGLAGSSVGSKLVDCLFDGTLTLSVSNNDLRAGGLLACSMDKAGNEITNCLMNGTINITNPTAYCGVIVGLVSKFSFTCTNTYYNSTTVSSNLSTDNPGLENNNGTAPACSMSIQAVDPNATGFNWGTIKNSLNNGRDPYVWGINGDKAEYPIPGEVDKDATPVTNYTITFDSNGGTTYDPVTKPENTVITLPSPTKSGYSFTGWNTANDGSGTTHAGGSSYIITGDATLYAQWTVYTTSFDANGFNTQFSTCDEADKYEAATLDTDGYYIIDNAGKLFWFANQVNAGNASYNAKVTKDIDMDGTNHPDFPGIGYYVSTAGGDRKPFSGNFDGQGHRIYNCNITTNNGSYWGSGLIGYAYATGLPKKEIKNFILEGKVTAKCGARAGGVLGYVADGYNISGITSSVDIESTTLKTGGLAGFVSTSTVSKCRFNGTITNSNNWTGGLIAEVLRSCEISDCLFDGTVNATRDNADVATGGIAAIIGGASANTVSNCLSYGTITTKKTGTNTGKVFGRVDGELALSNVYYGAQGTSTPTIDYNANGKTITGSVTNITTETWNEIKTSLNNGGVPLVWGINTQVYPVPGEVDATQYTITFNTNGGSTCASVTRSANTVITLPETTKVGFVFTGWDTKEDGTGTRYAAGANYTIINDVTLYAQWAVAYTIIFNTNGGSACESVTKAENSVITLPTSEKTGFVFNGWNTAEDGSGTNYDAGDSYTIIANATLYAQWKETYTITFNSKGGSACDAMSNVAGTQITLPTPIRADYIFNSWNTKEDGTGTSYAGGASYTITANATLYAQWTEDESGDYRNGFHKTHDTSAADYYQAPVEVTNENYESLGLTSAYVGYYEVKNAGNMYWISKNFSSIENTRKYVMTADINMDGENHNDWPGIATTYKADCSTHFQGVFDGLGHKFTNYYLKATSGNYKSMFGVVTNATIKNFSIDGQVEISVTNGIQYGAVVGRVNGGLNNTIEDIHSSVNITADNTKTISAIGGIVGQCSGPTNFNRCRYSGTITGNSSYNGLGGILGNAESTITFDNCLFDGTIKTDATPDRTTADNGLKLGGICSRNNSTNKTTITNSMSHGTISVKDAADKGNVGVIMGTQTSTGKLTITNTYYTAITGINAVGNNSNTDKSAAAPTEKTTQTWEEIKTSLNGSSNPVNWGINSQVYPVPGETDGVTLYTITFNTDGGTEIAPISQKAGTAVTSPTNPTKTGYTFAGWDKTIPTTMPAENITITAQWTINQYTITFNTNGGDAITDITKDYNTTITLPSAVKTGYRFDGWNTASDGSGTSYNGGANYTITASATLYAQYTINQYTITFNTDGGSAVASITQDYGTSVTAPANPTKTGHNFAGWVDENGTATTVPATMPAKNITLKATWTVIQYTIKFDLNGGTSAAIADITQDYGTAITAPADPTKDGWDFGGWDPAIPSTMPAENITCVACWYQDTYTNGFNDNWSTCAENKKYEAPKLITADRCSELGIDASYATDGYYEVKNAGNMFWISKYFSTIENNRKFVMTSNIDMEGNNANHKDWEGIATTYNADGSTHFKGVFDGLGHKFTNYYLNITYNNNKFNYKSLFGIIEGATIKNFSIDGQVDIRWVGSQYGSAVGRANNGTNTIEDVHSSVNFTVYDDKAASSIGGIVGQGRGTTNVNRCRYNGTITGNSAHAGLGGIVGNGEGIINISNCLFDGTITTTAKETRTGADNGIKIGGLFGRNTSTTKITNSMSIGTITVTPSEGTFDGANSNVGIIIGTQTSNNKLAITNTHYSTSNCTTGIGAVGNNSNTDKTSVAPTELPASPDWTVIRKTLGMSNWVIDQEKYGKEYPIPAVFICTHTYDQYGFCTICEAPEPIGEPDADGYYHIDHLADLAQFANMVNTSASGTEFNAKVTADIDLTDYGNTLTTTIGDASHHYCGTFDGQGHTMKGIKVVSDQRYVGLFACVGIKDTDASKVKNGIVKNFSVSGNVTATYFSKWNTNSPLVMGVIGEVYSGTIENVHSSVNFNCTSGTRSHIGGVVGGSLHMSTDQGEIVIKNCTYEGTMTLNACDAIGGILGYAQHKTKISNTMFSGSITQNYTLNANEEDGSQSEGNVSTYIGGVLGYCNSSSDGVQNCVLAGTMTTNQTIVSDGKMKKGLNNLNAVVGYDGQISTSYNNYLGNYVTETYNTNYHQYPSENFANTAKVRSDAQFVTGAICAELNADASATDNPWGQILGYQVGAHKDPNSPAQAYPYPGYTDPSKTTYRVVREANATDAAKYDYTADYYFFDDYGDTTPYPSDAASMKVKKIKYTRVKENEDSNSYMGIEGYNSMCLPFKFTTEMVPVGAEFYTYDRCSAESVIFKEITLPIEAGTPFIMKLDGSADWSQTIVVEAGTPIALSVENPNSAYGLYGVFNTVSLGTGYWKLNGDGSKLVKTKAESHCYPYRAYLKLPSASPSNSREYRPLFGTGNMELEEMDIELMGADGQIYYINGQKAPANAKGLVIENGKVVFKK